MADPAAMARAYLGIPVGETRWFEPDDARIAAAQLRALIAPESPVIPARNNEFIGNMAAYLSGHDIYRDYRDPAEKYRITPTGLEILHKYQRPDVAASTGYGVVEYGPGNDTIPVRAHERKHVEQSKELGEGKVRALNREWRGNDRYWSSEHPLEEPARNAETYAQNKHSAYQLDVRRRRALADPNIHPAVRTQIEALLGSRD